MTKENWLLISPPSCKPSFLIENRHCTGKIHIRSIENEVAMEIEIQAKI